ncbi:reverse transcriptase, putative [Trichonephila clavipes]|nr:reverse transcriptase, putative [Trichonephila clavipes]
MEATHSYFKTVWETPSPPVERTNVSPPSLVVESLSHTFVAGCLKTAENSAPGQDMVSYRHWREIDPSCSVLARIFNVCLKLADILSAWKTSKTVLIHKKGNVGQLNNWRPISLSDTIYKLFAKCMAKKLSK